MIDRRAFLARGAGAAAALVPLHRNLIAWTRDTASWIPGDALVARIPELLAGAKVPGVSMAVVDAGRVAWARAFGSADASRADWPVAPDTLFEAASLSKPVLAFVALRLVDRGALELDRPLSAYVTAPDLMVDERAARITARHVLTHSSGLPNWRFRATDELRTAFEPGAQFRYSGEGYFWLQRVIVQLTGTPFDRHVRDALFAPLGMPQSRFTWSPDLDDRLASGHDETGTATPSYNVRLGRQYADLAARWGKPLDRWTYDDGVRALTELDIGLASVPNFMMPNAAGTLITTATEYARFVAHLMTAPGIADELVRDMWTPHVPVRGALSRGLGWGLELVDGQHFVWHDGDNVFFKTFVVADPAERRAIVVFTNGQNGQAAYRPIVRGAVGRSLEALAGD